MRGPRASHPYYGGGDHRPAMRRVAALLVVVAVATVAAGCFGPPKKMVGYAPDLESATSIVLYNGTVWTADDLQPWATAVAIQGDRILAVGSDREVFGANLGARPLWVDLGGRFVTPGFHDTHNHVIEVAQAWDPSTGTNPFETWEPSTGDDAVGDEQGRAARASCHYETYAEAQLRQAANQDPRQSGDAEGTLCTSETSGLDEGQLPPINVAALREALQVGLYTAASYGITSHIEQGIPLSLRPLLELYESEGVLPGRLNLYVFPEDLGAALSAGLVAGDGTPKVRLLGMKVYTDGWLGPRTAALRENYADRPSNGLAFYTQAELDELVADAHAGGLKVTAHAIGDRAIDMVLSAYERAEELPCNDHAVCRDPRFSLEHASLVPPDLVERMVALDVAPSIQMSFATSDHGFVGEALGPERAAYVYPWRTLHDAGLTLGGSSDFPSEVLAPLWGVQRVVTRMELTGEPAGGFMPAQTLDLETALRMITIDAAYLEFREHELGSLTPGKYADVVVLERNLFEIPANEIAKAGVAATIVGGRPSFVSGDIELPGVPAPEGGG